MLQIRHQNIPINLATVFITIVLISCSPKKEKISKSMFSEIDPVDSTEGILQRILTPTKMLLLTHELKTSSELKVLKIEPNDIFVGNSFKGIINLSYIAQQKPIAILISILDKRIAFRMPEKFADVVNTEQNWYDTIHFDSSILPGIVRMELALQDSEGHVSNFMPFQWIFTSPWDGIQKNLKGTWRLDNSVNHAGKRWMQFDGDGKAGEWEQKEETEFDWLGTHSKKNQNNSNLDGSYTCNQDTIKFDGGNSYRIIGLSTKTLLMDPVHSSYNNIIMLRRE